MKYHLLTLGCQMNLSDSERVRTVIESMGYEFTADESEANLIGILACSVRQKAIDKVYSKIHKWNKVKNQKNLITFISGCILPADSEKFLKLFDIVFHMGDLQTLPDLIQQYGMVTPSLHSYKREAKKFPSAPNNFWFVTPSYQSNFEAFVPIQNGCDKFCTFCAVPYTRGREVSRPSSEILDEVKLLVEKGYKTITLLGQNVNSYGLDKKGEELSFSQLLDSIGKFVDQSNHECWIYFTSPHPRDMTNDLIDVISNYRSLAKQIHLPLQSGDEKVLMKMNRNHNLLKYSEIVSYIRAKIPEATLFTDIIVGFSGESEEQFENTRKSFEQYRFNMAYIAVYSPRPGAAAYRWEDTVPQEEKKQRLHILTDDLKAISKEWNVSMIGKKVRVLVTGTDRKSKFLTGLTEGKINVRFATEDPWLIGTFVDLQITVATDFSVEGELIPIQITAEV